MTYAARIRTWLILIALLPPLLVMWVIYSYSENQLRNADRNDAHRGLERYERFFEAYSVDLLDDIQQLSQSGSVTRAVAAIRSGRPERVNISELPPGIDFLEILNQDFTVAASVRRPGLLGERIQDDLTIARLEPMRLMPTVEYDRRGPNPCGLPAELRVQREHQQPRLRGVRCGW